MLEYDGMTVDSGCDVGVRVLRKLILVERL